MTGEQEHSGGADSSRTRRHDTLCPIIGLGASAGGLEAFEAFLRAPPPHSGMAFVLIQHLDPTHKSMLSDLLGRCTAMPVLQVTGNTRPEADHVYLIPPNKGMIIEDGVLKLLEPSEPRGQRTPIDLFFRSLAQDQGDNAACVILSGTGSDGTMGLRAVKESGGLTMAQAEGSAKFDSMPKSATATGLGDYVLPPEQMPAILIDYFRNLGYLEARKGAEGLLTDAADFLTKICAILQTRTGHDFSRYKKNTLIRRIQRRMQVLQLTEVPEYIGVLRKGDDEVHQLFRDLLINVTQFFRDQDAFAALGRDVIPKIVDGRGPDPQIRLWVPGCSTGEEAYSLAILLSERIREAGLGARVQIFASDIDEEALDIARIGRYPDTIVKDVTPDRLERFFTPTDSGYLINKEIRDMCIFSVHSVIKDPPFTRLDLISCRNLLIYLGGPLQDKLIPIFHYALRPGGFLFLGPSENISQHSRLFSPIDPANRIFSRRDTPSPHDFHFPLGGPVTFQPELRPLPRRGGEHEKEEQQRLAERLILDGYAPAFAVVSENGDIVQVSNRTGKYLELPGGTPNLNVVNMARPGLRNDIRVALRKAVRESRRVVQTNIEFGVNGGRQVIDLVVDPVSRTGHYMVVFQDIGALRAEIGGDAQARAEPPESEDSRIHELETDLQLTKERLRTTIEELETSNEELKSSNEEMMSMNEELQSTNEELESSREELQSINEELETVNTELRHKVQELSRANSDLQNLFDSTQIATIFLGNDLRIKNFTPAAKKIFSLIESDRGRPLVDLAAKFPLDGLEEAAAGVVHALMPVEREIGHDSEGPHLLMRIVPYRTVENAIEGVVLTFVDVTRLKLAERSVAQSEARYRAVLQGAHDTVLIFPLDETNKAGTILEANAAARRLLGYADELARLTLADLVAPAELAGWLDELLRKGTVVAERTYRAKDGTQVPVEESAALVNTPGQRLVVILARDIRERKENQRRQELLMRELQHRVKNTMATVTAIVTHTGRRAEDFDTFKALLDGRIQALAATHGRLTESNWEPVPLRTIVQDVLKAYAGEDRISITGDDITITPKAALTLSMALHELATNAAKYGALSVPSGDIHITWTQVRNPSPALEIQWKEQNGPEVPASPGRGFGRFLLEKGIAHDLDGEVDLRFEPQGVRCRILVPWSQAVGGRHQAPKLT
ncbi:MAG: PAS domain-containing protein [Magnetospirillum sp.]|nr:PAS domain-containing protein [Magnetospirillum sp.]